MRPEEYIVGYHYIVPVCCEEYIFDIPFSASPSTLLVRYEELIVSAFLRRLHTSTLQPSTGVPVHCRYPLPRLLEHRVTPAQWLSRSSPLRSSNDYVYIVLWRFAEYISSITNAHWLWRHHCNYALRGMLLCLYLRRLQFQEHHDFSVTGYVDILPERFEEYLLDYHGTHLN